MGDDDDPRCRPVERASRGESVFPRSLVDWHGRQWRRLASAVQAAGLILVVLGTFFTRASPSPRLHGKGLVVSCSVVVLVLAWLAWVRAPAAHRLRLVGLLAMSAAGGVLAVVSAHGPGPLVGSLVIAAAASELAVESSLCTLAAGLLGAVVTVPVADARAGAMLACTAAFCGSWLLGLIRRSHRLRAAQAELTLSQERRAIAAEKQAAALEERTRIAREIHDILAHSWSALSITLHAADGFLSSGELPAEQPDLRGARDCLQRAVGLAKDGMTETRRAILALRQEPRPLPDLLAELATRHESDSGTHARLIVSGAPTPLRPDTLLTAYRTAQEALTNARKHAPSAPVHLHLAYDQATLDLTVRNPLAPARSHRPLGASGSGFGLTGLAERAELAGGTMTAEPDDSTWRLHLRIPL